MVKELSYTDKISFFFGQNPHGHSYSTLRLLLNDIHTCSKVGQGDQLIFPQAMCLMVIVDLLGKMHSGKDIKNVGPGFKEFVEKFILDPTTYGNKIGEAIYQFRNSLHHSYRMWTEWTPVTSGGHEASRQFVLDRNPSQQVVQHHGNDTIINFPLLRDAIYAGIEKFRNHLQSTVDDVVKANFVNMFIKHGWMSIG